MDVEIRKESPSDYSKIYEINRLAFGQENESQLIEKLRNRTAFNDELSQVAEYKNDIVGHILFTDIKITSGKKSFDTLALAPMSVRPDFQKKGIGSELVKNGLKKMKALGFRSVIVLGHPNYYPKFGFQPASKWNIQCPFEVPDEVFMAIELVDNELVGKSGMVEYPKEFLEV